MNGEIFLKIEIIRMLSACDCVVYRPNEGADKISILGEGKGPKIGIK
jgi:hypothetical protein